MRYNCFQAEYIPSRQRESKEPFYSLCSRQCTISRSADISNVDLISASQPNSSWHMRHLVPTLIACAEGLLRVGIWKSLRTAPQRANHRSVYCLCRCAADVALLLSRSFEVTTEAAASHCISYDVRSSQPFEVRADSSGILLSSRSLSAFSKRSAVRVQIVTETERVFGPLLAMSAGANLTCLDIGSIPASHWSFQEAC